MISFSRQQSPANDETQSPLWPLQSAMRNIFVQAINSGAATAADIARVAPTRSTTEDMFKQWQQINPATLRAAIREYVSPPNLDLSDSELLSGFQDALLALPQWEDEL